jgi:hypothetical protein
VKKNRHGRLRRCATDMETTHSHRSTGHRAGQKNNKASRHLRQAENLQNESAIKLAAIQKKDAT